jgi:transcriptional regulator with XRE-family HTH domain
MEPHEVVKQARAAKGLTQQELADLLPVGIDAVRAIERGRDRPSQRTARAMDQALDTGGAIAAAYGFATSSLDWPAEAAELRSQIGALAVEVTALNERLQALLRAEPVLTAAPPPKPASRQRRPGTP